MSDTPQQRPRFPWRLFWLLFVAGTMGALAAIPFAIELIGPAIPPTPANSPPLPVIVAIGIVQNLVLLAAMVFVGLKLGRPFGLGAPLLEAWLYKGSPGKDWKKSLRDGLVTGVAVGVVLLVIVLVLVPLLPKLPFIAAARITIWKRILICFYGGIYEELLTRLFLLTLIARIASRILRGKARTLAATPFWIANVVVAILFGLGHLPSASLMMPITPLVVGAALLLNGVAGIAFGLLYRKHGLESAMIAHFSADFMLYVVGVSFL